MLLFFWIAKKTFRITSKCPLPDSFFSFHQWFWPPFFSDFLFFLLSGYWSVFVFCNKKRPLRIHSKWPYPSQKAGTMSLIIFLSGFPETRTSYLFYRYKYKSQNHNNTRCSMRQQSVFFILCHVRFLYFVSRINYAIKILLSAGITIYFFLPVIHFFPMWIIISFICWLSILLM